MLFILGVLVGIAGAGFGAYWLKNKLNAMHVDIQNPIVVTNTTKAGK